MIDIISREYEEFLKQEFLQRKLSIYEQACKLAERIISIKPTKGLNEQIKSAIEFSHLKITPAGALSLAVLVGAIFFLVPLALFLFFGSLSISTILFIVVTDSILIYFLLDYPVHYSTVFRIKASSEMILATVYMSISMHISPNIENAIGFASKNLKGALATDLRALLWDIYTRKFMSISDAFDWFISKWKRDGKEFSEGLYIIKNSVFESTAKRETMLGEAVNVVLEGTKDRMRDYSRKLRNPVTVLNSLGILLPVVGLVFFPIVSIFLPDLVKPIMLIVGYDFFLPVFVYFFMMNYLSRRPYSFHQPDLSKHPAFIKEKLIEKPYFIPLIVSIPLIITGSYFCIKIKELFTTTQLISSSAIILGIILGIISYSYLSVRRKIKVRNEIVEIESEFTEALYQLGRLISRGTPLESALEKLTRDIKDLKIVEFFKIILYNISVLGMTFERAVFDPKSGAINYYPSTLVEAIMHVIIDTSRRGMASACKAMLTISTYLKDMHQVNEELKGLMEENTSTMSMQAMLLAPLSAGIVVSLTAIVIQIMVSLGEAFQSMYSTLGSSFGTAGQLGSGVLSSIINLNQIIPFDGFQVIVGVYTIEIVTMLAIFLSSISNGEESFMKRLTIARLMAIATVVYFGTLLITYFMFTSIVPVTKIIVP
jgi:hypothetical protein